ncbi:MAG: OB-fold nucleic acid binding domain-containing protein, partial [Spirochaetota bacterium]
MLKNLPIELLKTIGPARGALLREEAGIDTVEDLIYYAPRRYLDRSAFSDISSLCEGQQITVSGTVSLVRIEGYGRKFLSVKIDDGTGSLCGIFFGGVQYLQRAFSQGDQAVFAGKVEIYRGQKQIVHPEFDFIEEDTKDLVNTGRIIPLYHSTEKLQKAGFSSRGFRKLVHQAIKNYLPGIEDPLPEDIRRRHSLMEYGTALKMIHFPESLPHTEEARLRLAFNELFFLQYYLQMTKRIAREADT